MAGAGTSGGTTAFASGGSDPKVLQSLAVVWGSGGVGACHGGMVGFNLRA